MVMVLLTNDNDDEDLFTGEKRTFKKTSKPKTTVLFPGSSSPPILWTANDFCKGRGFLP